MTSYQDFEQAKDKEEFLRNTIREYRNSAEYTEMLENELYLLGENPFLARAARRVVLEGLSLDLDPQIKISSGLFGILVGHIVGRLWDNPVQVGHSKTQAEREEAQRIKGLLGEEFDCVAPRLATYSATHGVSYAFYNHKRTQLFKATEFLPFPDELTGMHRAGVRFWRIGDDKPWNVQLYEIDGFTWWRMEPDGVKMEIFRPKTPYKRGFIVYKAGDEFTERTPGENYPEFPVVPYYINPLHTSEMTPPLRSKINAHDMKETAYMDEALRERFLYWVIQGYGGDAKELASMMRLIRELGIIAEKGDESKVNVKSVDPPYLSHNSTLKRLVEDFYRDARILNPEILTSGGVTTVAIKAALQREDTKMVQVENEARRFVRRLLAVAGVGDVPIVFKHKTITDDEAIARQLGMLKGLPFEYQVKLSPVIPTEMEDEILEVSDDVQE